MSERQILRPFVQRLVSHTKLTDEEIRALLSVPVTVEQVSSNRDFVAVGQKVDHACVVVDGVVARFDVTAEGQRQITALHIAGDAPDLHSVVRPRARAALSALGNVTIARLLNTALRDLAAQFPAIAEAFWRDCTFDADLLAQWVVNLGRRDAKARLAHLMCELAVRMKVPEVEGRIEFALPLTQTHLGDATGLTSVHVNRMLKVLRDDGTMSFLNRTVVISDWKKLARTGEFNAGYLK